MVDRQIKGRGVLTPRVLAAMREVPRELFISPQNASHAYEDAALPIEEGQTISQPYIVARMMEALDLRPSDRVLEIGTGSGYTAALLSSIVAEVYTVERIASLAERAAQRLRNGGYRNVLVRTGDGTLGWPDFAPFDAIVVAAGAPTVPDSLLAQLAIGGRLVIPIGSTPRRQQLVRVVRKGEHEFVTEVLCGVVFVPLIGAEGWPDQPAQSLDQMDTSRPT